MSSYNNSLIGLGNVLQTTLGAFSTTPVVKADSLVIQEKQMEILKNLSKEEKSILKKEFSKIMSKFQSEFKREFRSIARSNFDFTRSISAKAKKSIQKEIDNLRWERDMTISEMTFNGLAILMAGISGTFGLMALGSAAATWWIFGAGGIPFATAAGVSALIGVVFSAIALTLAIIKNSYSFQTKINDLLEKLDDADSKLNSIQLFSWVHPSISKTQKEVASLKEKLKNSKRESYFDNSVSTSYSGY